MPTAPPGQAAPAPSFRRPYRIEQWVRRCKAGQPVKLQDQPFQVLVALVERSGEVVTREELREKVWPTDTFIDFYNALTIAVAKLRQTLSW